MFVPGGVVIDLFTRIYAEPYLNEAEVMHPTHRTSPGRTRRRRSHDALTSQPVTQCPSTGQPKQHHRVCQESGYYRPGLTIRVPKLGIGIDR